MLGMAVAVEMLHRDHGLDAGMEGPGSCWIECQWRRRGRYHGHAGGACSMSVEVSTWAVQCPHPSSQLHEWQWACTATFMQIGQFLASSAQQECLKACSIK